MKSATVRYINSANYLLNIKNENQSQPCNLKNLRRTLSLNSPIKLSKNLRQLPKNCRKRYYNGKLSNNSKNNQLPEPKNNVISSTNLEENVALKPETPDGLLSPSKR
uniref:Uncharacterized protein n=1 Tax=Romanomermis culicivorax TaxID=13658 RepID=A0A915J9W8_ROMCU